jgi:4-amino-4-deoxy-L-arabinose transferase-like glycosyltransferase
LAEWVLAALVSAGITLRVIALASYWPVVTNLSDSTVYAEYAQRDIVGNPQHPAGYSTFLAIIGLISHQVAVVTVLQHLLGIVTALLLYYAVRRLTRSPWPGLIPAAVLLLSSDQIFLEQNIMSETLFSVLLAAGLYCAVRAIDSPDPWWRWPIATGALMGIAAFVRTDSAFLLPVLFLAMLLVNPRRTWRKRLVAPGAALASAVVILLGYGVVNEVAHGEFTPAPSPGWHLYGRVAPFADCSQFTPPEGTEALCNPEPPGGRVGNDWYLFYPESPAVKTFGYIGQEDQKLKAFAMQVIEHQPRAYLSAVFDTLKTYFVPDTRHDPPMYSDSGLSTELDWIREVPEPLLGEIRSQMESFFDPFTVHESLGGTRFLMDYEHPFRFGATLLTLCSLLTLLGLLIGDRRQRIGVLLFGVGGLSMLILSSFGAWYVGRYTVPIAGPVSAGASIAVLSLWRLERARRRGATPGAEPDPA